MGLATILALFVSPPGHAQVQITNVTDAFASSPGTIQIQGGPFVAPITVTLDGVPTPATLVNPVAIDVPLSPGAPGVFDVVVTTGLGSASAENALSLWPSLQVEGSSPGADLLVGIGSGEPGFGWLFFSAGLLANPVPLPGIDFGVQLDALAGVYPAFQGEATAPPVSLFTVPVPRKPGLVGQTLHFQGLELILPTAGGFAISFTNAESVTFGQVAFGPPASLTYAADPVFYEVGVPIEPNVPSVEGRVDLFAAPGGLPPGLTLDPASGVLSGTPQVVAPAIGYTITAENALGSTQTQLDITVLAPFELVSCSLGCTAGSCAVSDVAPNTAFEFTFAQPLDALSVSLQSVQVTNVSSGSPAPGQFLVEGDTLRFEPQLTFDPTGQPVWGLAPGETYRIFLPGKDTSPGPYLQSEQGLENATSLDCVVQVTQPVEDVVVGAPSVAFFFEEPSGALTPIPGSNPIVPLDAEFLFEFSEAMSPGSLVDGLGGSPTLVVSADVDGSLLTTDDLLPVPGTFSYELSGFEQARVRFSPAGGLPAAPVLGAIAVVLEVLPGNTDLVGNPLGAAGPVTVFPETAPQTPFASLPFGTGETFQSLDAIDTARSGAELDLVAGVASFGRGGGSGALGDLVVAAGEVVALSTDPSPGASFEPGSLIDDYVVAGVAAGTKQIVVTDGVFEFASLVVEPGGVLELTGEQAARLFVRGEARIEGTLRVDGEDAGLHVSSVGFGDVGGPGGPAAGDGGDGGDRPDLGATELAVGGTFLGFDHAPGAVIDVDGSAGEGRGGAPVGTQGSPQGGVHWPVVLPGPTIADLGDFVPNSACESAQVGAPGGGGSYATLGGDGFWASPNPTIGIPPAPPTAFGGASVLSAEQTDLDPEGDALVGGAGGGGGGLGIARTRSNGFPLADCALPSPGSTQLELLVYRDHSGAAGGGGGGALQVQAGATVAIDGLVSARGGDGGSPDTSATLPERYAAPGGGGSGGAVLLQAPELALGPLAVLDLRGGVGGFNGVAGGGSRGGDGGAGIARLESDAGFGPALGDVLDAYLPTPGLPGAPTVAEAFALAGFPVQTEGPGTASGFQSCWIQGADGFVFTLEFANESPAQGQYSWNANVRLSNGQEVALRGPSAFQSLFGTDLQTLLGNDLGTSPLVVRFQGVRLLTPVEDLCGVEFADGSLVLADSLTPWVATPAELEGYWTTALGDPVEGAKRRPNAFRYQVVLDRAAPNAGLVDGVTTLEVFGLGF